MRHAATLPVDLLPVSQRSRKPARKSHLVDLLLRHLDSSASSVTYGELAFELAVLLPLFRDLIGTGSAFCIWKLKNARE